MLKVLKVFETFRDWLVILWCWQLSLHLFLEQSSSLKNSFETARKEGRKFKKWWRDVIAGEQNEVLLLHDNESNTICMRCPQFIMITSIKAQKISQLINCCMWEFLPGLTDTLTAHSLTTSNLIRFPFFLSPSLENRARASMEIQQFIICFTLISHAIAAY